MQVLFKKLLKFVIKKLKAVPFQRKSRIKKNEGLPKPKNRQKLSKNVEKCKSSQKIAKAGLINIDNHSINYRNYATAYHQTLE